MKLVDILNKIVKYSIYVLVFLVPLFWLPFSFEAYEFNKQYLLLFLTTFALFSWLAKMVFFDKEIRFKRTSLDLPILAFLGVALFSTLFSVDRISSLFGFYGRFSDGLIGLFGMGMLYFLITNNVKDKSDKVEKILKVFLYSVLAVISISYLSILGVFSRIPGLPGIMGQRTFNPVAGSLDGLSMFLAIVIALLIGLFLTNSKLPLLENKRIPKLPSFIYWFLLFGGFGLILIADFVPALITLLIVLFLSSAFSFWQSKTDRKWLYFLGFILVLLVFLVMDPLRFLALPKEQVLGQADSWRITFSSLTESIKSGLLGNGPGTFHYEFAKFKPLGFNENSFWQIRFDRPSSYIAEILGTMGLMGLLTYFWIIRKFFLSLIANYKKHIPLSLAFLAILTSQFVYYQNTVLAFTFWLFLALIVVSLPNRLPSLVISLKDFSRSYLMSRILIVILGITLVFFYSFQLKFYFADIQYQNSTLLFPVNAKRIELLEKAASINPYRAHYKIILARAYLNRIISEMQKPPDLVDQLTLSDYIYRAINVSKGGIIDGKVVKGAVEVSPNRVVGWGTLGIVYREIQLVAQGAPEWGVKAFEKSIELEPTNPIFYTELGKLYLFSGEIEKGREEFEKAIELKSDYIEAHIQLALTYEQDEDLLQSLQRMKILSQQFPMNIDVLFQLGRLYFNSNLLDEAITQLKIVVNLVPSHSNAHYVLGASYEKNGDIDLAIVEFEKVLNLNPGNPDVEAKLKDLRK
jgi:tetratricopeptide (TPR) repeat protein